MKDKMKKKFCFRVVHVHKDRIIAGDVIVCPDGRERTVCQGDIRYNSLMGVTIFGDSYHAGHKLIPRITK
jgi:hypothetical protein